MAKEEDMKRVIQGARASMEVSIYGHNLWNKAMALLETGMAQMQADMRNVDDFTPEEVVAKLNMHTKHLQDAFKYMLISGRAFADGCECILGPMFAMLKPDDREEQARIEKTSAQIARILDKTYFTEAGPFNDPPPQQPLHQPNGKKANVSKNDISFHSMQAANALYRHYGTMLATMPQRLNTTFGKASLENTDWLKDSKKDLADMLAIVGNLGLACDLLINYSMVTIPGSGTRNKDAWTFLRKYYGCVVEVREKFPSLIAA